jgi:hypothetical protein
VHAAHRLQTPVCVVAPDVQAQLQQEAAAARAAGEPYDRTTRAHFLVYQRMGGRRSEAQYLADLEHFFEYTLEVFTMGETDVVVTRPNGRRLTLDSCGKASRAFTKDYLGGDAREWHRFFTSVDSVSAYT